MSLYDESIQVLDENQLIADNLAKLERQREAARHEVTPKGTASAYARADQTMITYRIGEQRPTRAPLPVLPATHDLDRNARRDASYRQAVSTYRQREQKRLRQHRVAGR